MKLIDDSRNKKIELSGRTINGKLALMVQPPREYIDRRMVQIDKYLKRYEHVSPDQPYSTYMVDGSLIVKSNREHLNDCIKIIASIVDRESTEENYNFVFKDLDDYKGKIGDAEHQQYLEQYHYVAEKYAPGIESLTDEHAALLVQDLLKKNLKATSTLFSFTDLRKYSIYLEKELLTLHAKNSHLISLERGRLNTKSQGKNTQ